MKTIFALFISTILLQTTVLGQSSANTWATTDNYKTLESVGRDVRAKKYDKAATTVLTHKEIQRRSKLSAREIELLKNPKKAATDARKDPLTFASKHKSSFWDRFRKRKTVTKSAKK